MKEMIPVFFSFVRQLLLVLIISLLLLCILLLLRTLLLHLLIPICLSLRLPPLLVGHEVNVNDGGKAGAQLCASHASNFPFMAPCAPYMGICAPYMAARTFLLFYHYNWIAKLLLPLTCVVCFLSIGVSLYFSCDFLKFS